MNGKMNDQISIIVAIFNVEDYLERCLESIIKQSYKNLDIILVDDGSTDSSLEICDNFCRRDKRFRCIHKENGGLSDARNCGIEAAMGKYLSFIDGDDFVHPQMYQVLYENIIKFNVFLAACSFQTFEEGDTIFYNQEFVKGKAISSKDAIELLYTLRRTDIITACCKLYKKELFQTIRFPVGRYREDEFTTYKLIIGAKKVYYTEEKLYYYFQREGSIMHSSNIKKETDYYDALMERHEYLDKVGWGREGLDKDAFFCMRQLYNVFFLCNSLKTVNKRYLKYYKLMYDQSPLKYKLKEKSFVRYWFARYFPDLFINVWRIKLKYRR